MPRCILIAELATNHAGDMALAKAMIQAAAAAGADIVKTQGYQIEHLSHADPQYDWFRQAALSDDDHRMLATYAEAQGVRYLSTGYTVSDIVRLHWLGQRMIKIGSGEGLALLEDTLAWDFTDIYLSLAWGGVDRHVQQALFDYRDRYGMSVEETHALASRVHPLATVPLYPAPIETYARVLASHGEGYSDHHVGLDVAKLAIAQGAPVLEKHFQIDGRGRNQAWNMNADGLAELRRWATVCAIAIDGTAFGGRWHERA